MAETNILVVDDEQEIADLVEIYLVSDGYKVFKASNAQDGLDILDKEDIHLCLLDIMMPGMNGLEMCKKIRETNNIPIIMLSAKSTDLDKILGLGTGADDYVVKPFNPLELTARVKSQLRRYTQLNPNSNVHETVKNEISIRGLTINKDNHKASTNLQNLPGSHQFSQCPLHSHTADIRTLFQNFRFCYGSELLPNQLADPFWF